MGEQTWSMSRLAWLGLADNPQRRKLLARSPEYENGILRWSVFLNTIATTELDNSGALEHTALHAPDAHDL